MYFQESDILLRNNPEYRVDIQTIDNFLHSLRPEEQLQLDINVIADITGLRPEIIEFIFDRYCEYGLLMRKKYITCPNEGDIIREINDEELEKLPIEDFCDICDEEHTFKEEDVRIRYCIRKFTKQPEKKDVMRCQVSPTEELITEDEVNALSDTMPILAYLSSNIPNDVLRDKRFIIVLHFLKDLIPFMKACEEIGLNPAETLLFYKEYLYPHKDSIIRYFQNKGYLVSSLDSLDEVLPSFQERCRDDRKSIIIVEDGGYIIPKIHGREYKEIKAHVIGAVEQTTKGEREDGNIRNLAFPILSIARSNLKNRFEPPHVARAMINNLQRLLNNINFSSQKVLLIGYGTIGKEIAIQLRDTLRMNVTIYDSDAEKMVEAIQNGFDTCSYLSNGVSDKYMIIGATGETSIGRGELLSMRHNVYLVSASSDQREIGLQELTALSSKQEEIKSNGKKVGTKYTIRGRGSAINLIADGYPINFWAEESMPNNVSDIIMSLIYLSIVEIASNNESLEKKIHTERINELVRDKGVNELYLEYYHPEGGI